jgi:hypothetical protein
MFRPQTTDHRPQTISIATIRFSSFTSGLSGGEIGWKPDLDHLKS